MSAIGRVLLTASTVCVLSACGSNARSPTSPTPAPSPVTTLTGVWQVSYNGRSSRSCRTSSFGTQATVFRLTQQGRAVSGTMFDVEVSGSASADGSITLHGLVTEFGSRSEVRATLRPAQDSSNFTGQLTATLKQGVDPCGVSIDAQILEAHRVAIETSPSSFAGIWTGSFGVQDCSFVGWTFCTPVQKGTTSSLFLELTQAQSSVSGRLRLAHGISPLPTPYDAPVTGTATDRRLVLEGSVSTPVSGGRDILRLTGWSTTRDELGQMSGSFSYVEEFVTNSGVYSTTSQNVLVGVTLNATP